MLNLSILVHQAYTFWRGALACLHQADLRLRLLAGGNLVTLAVLPSAANVSMTEASCVNVLLMWDSPFVYITNITDFGGCVKGFVIRASYEG